MQVVNAFSQELHDGNSEQINSENSQWAERKGATDDFIGFYQRFISDVKGSDCPMYPSCSNYGKWAFQQRPFFEAVILTSDRLIRCGHQQASYPLTKQYGTIRRLDYPEFSKESPYLELKSDYLVSANNFRATNKTDSVVGFVNQLINQRDYEAALLEIKRLRYYGHGSEKYLYLKLLECYEALHRDEDGIFDYQTRCSALLKEDDAIKTQIAWMYYNVRNYVSAKEILLDCSANYVERKNTLLHALIALRVDDKKSFEHAMKSINDSIQSPTLMRQNLMYMQRYATYHPKSVRLASALSVVPGLGYLYLKQPQNAIAAFVLNAALGYAVATSIDRKNYGVAAFMGFFSLSFYLGNIVGAGKSARRINNRTKESIINNLYQTNYY